MTNTPKDKVSELVEFLDTIIRHWFVNVSDVEMLKDMKTLLQQLRTELDDSENLRKQQAAEIENLKATVKMDESIMAATKAKIFEQAKRMAQLELELDKTQLRLAEVEDSCEYWEEKFQEQKWRRRRD